MTDTPTAQPLVVAHQLVKHFPLDSTRGPLRRRGHRVVQAVENVNLEILRGEVVGLIGESGSGKSTLGRSLLRLHQLTAGNIIFDGDNITHLRGEPLRHLRRRMTLVFQNPYAAVNRRRRVRDVVAQPLVAHGIGSAGEQSGRVRDLLEAVGVEALAERYPHELSGGQLQRVVIARALATDPDFIVADEPTASLDVSVRAQVVNVLSDLRAERSIALLFISHDLRTVSHVANRIAVMYLGKILEVGPAREITREPKHPYTTSLIGSLPQLHGSRDTGRNMAQDEIPNSAEPPPGCRYHPRCPFAVERCRIEQPKLERKAQGRLVACHLVPVDDGTVPATPT